ncbi:hypothetical protein LWI29_012010 [Acer saccharum]|uniref:Dynamin-type G domain-containing protein n=1 Tax=Acer saccharum TaxID=4024 RepID=A0AA39T1S1_ACESA|nr:hypothetical protein LWI29_012010 [Acer saccharum]
MLPQGVKKTITDNPKKLANLIDLVNLPSTLREFVGQSRISRLGCFMHVWSYIKTNNLQSGPDERSIPGNTVAVQADMPFSGLTTFGTAFLSKFECSQMPHSLLEHITFVDTPGVLSGEKQRTQRAYDFTGVTSWFAVKCDLILLLFDPYKLDASDEFKHVISSLRGHDDKICVVLNKADQVDTQQLMRVYGALMWSLGKVLNTPEVSRVYIGSFNDKPVNEAATGPIGKELFEREQEDLLSDLKDIPKKACDRRINEFVKRARAAKIHAYIISHLKKEMPAMIGKAKIQVYNRDSSTTWQMNSERRGMEEEEGRRQSGCAVCGGFAACGTVEVHGLEGTMENR